MPPAYGSSPCQRAVGSCVAVGRLKAVGSPIAVDRPLADDAILQARTNRRPSASPLARSLDIHSAGIAVPRAGDRLRQDTIRRPRAPETHIRVVVPYEADEACWVARMRRS